MVAKATWVNHRPLVCFDFKTRLPKALTFVMGFPGFPDTVQ